MKKTIVILGAGITGLVSAYYLSKKFKVILVEKENFIGGTAASFAYKGFILDYGPHKLYTELSGIIEEIQKVCPLLRIKKKNSIYLRGNYYDFPLKISQVATKMPFTAFLAGTEIITKNLNKLPDDSYENFLINRFGKTLYNLSFRDYAYKVWGSNPKELDAELARRRIAISNIFELIKSIIFKDSKKISAEYFYYPEKGIRQLLESLAREIKKNGGKILLNEKIKEIKIARNNVESIKLSSKTIKNPDKVISTIPLDSLLEIAKPKIQTDFKFYYQDLNIIYFILNKQRALRDCWIFFPEKKFIFQRVSEQKAFSPNTSPNDKTAVMVETTRKVDSNLIEQIIKQLELADILKKDEIEEYFIKPIPKAYPVYKKGFDKELKKLMKYLESIENFYLLGRQGLFNYNNMDQCWDMSLKIAEQIKQNKTKKDWERIKRYFESYRIVD